MIELNMLMEISSKIYNVKLMVQKNTRILFLVKVYS